LDNYQRLQGHADPDASEGSRLSVRDNTEKDLYRLGHPKVTLTGFARTFHTRGYAAKLCNFADLRQFACCRKRFWV